MFTIDNAPSSRWHDEIFNMYSWCTAELQDPNAIVAKSSPNLWQELQED